MRIGFRVDSSSIIGSGHVYRCLTIATALSKRGNDIEFLTKCLPGNIISKIIECGFSVKILRFVANNKTDDANPYGRRWLGCSIDEDLSEVRQIIGSTRYDWIVLDHYGLDEDWESGILEYTSNLMVIDDLRETSHNCTLLVNQNLGADEYYHSELKGVKCACLGTKFAIIRDEFRLLRNQSILSRKNRQISKILISMGGVDKDNVTLLALNAIKDILEPLNINLRVVVGAASTSLEKINKFVRNHKLRCEIIVDANNMADLMKDSDIALAASGASMLERCVMGLPMLNFILAENQRNNAENIQALGAGITVWDYSQPDRTSKISNVFEEILLDQDRLNIMSTLASHVTDGNGVELVLNKIYEHSI